MLWEVNWEFQTKLLLGNCTKCFSDKRSDIGEKRQRSEESQLGHRSFEVAFECLSNYRSPPNYTKITNVVPHLRGFDLCTCKWGNFALVESHLCEFPKICITWGPSLLFCEKCSFEEAHDAPLYQLNLRRKMSIGTSFVKNCL